MLAFYFILRNINLFSQITDKRKDGEHRLINRAIVFQEEKEIYNSLHVIYIRWLKNTTAEQKNKMIPSYAVYIHDDQSSIVQAKLILYSVSFYERHKKHFFFCCWRKKTRKWNVSDKNSNGHFYQLCVVNNF